MCVYFVCLSTGIACKSSSRVAQAADYQLETTTRTRPASGGWPDLKNRRPKRTRPPAASGGWSARDAATFHSAEWATAAKWSPHSSAAEDDGAVDPAPAGSAAKYLRISWKIVS